MTPVKDRHPTYTEVTESGCHLWTGSIHRTGYGRITVKDAETGRWRPELAHRVAYEEYVGPIPDGLVLDHTCHDPASCRGGWSCLHRRCINPAHLEPVTPHENLMRGRWGQGSDLERKRQRQNEWGNRKVACPICGKEGMQRHRARHAKLHA